MNDPQLDADLDNLQRALESKASQSTKVEISGKLIDMQAFEHGLAEAMKEQEEKYGSPVITAKDNNTDKNNDTSWTPWMLGLLFVSWAAFVGWHLWG